MNNTAKKILVSVLTAGTLVTTGCGAKSSTAEAIKIGVPSDATNQARAINLLASAGLIEVDPDAGYTPELADITKYIYGNTAQNTARLNKMW